MDGQPIVIVVVAGVFLVLGIIAIVVLRGKDNLGGKVNIRGVGSLEGRAGNNPRDASITDAEGRDITADAPQGSATITKAKATRDVTATAGGTRDPKA